MQQPSEHTQPHPKGSTARSGWMFALVGLWALLGGSEHARADAWCASPVWVHEWGVHVFNGAGDRTAKPIPWPKFFYGDASTSPAIVTPVRHFPPDSGIRELPVVHFYAPGHPASIPVAFEVGFTEGRATLWYPQVDTLRSANDANSAWAKTQREALLKARAARTPLAPSSELGPDPTRQLGWESLTLNTTPAHPLPKDPLAAWPEALRALDKALWINSATESERFLFYEGTTAEKPLLKVERGPSWSATKPHYVLRNTSAFAVHDVFVIQRDPGSTNAKVFYVSSIPAGAYAGFLLDGPALGADDFRKQTHDLLQASLVDPKDPTPPEHYDPSAVGCLTDRDPAIPFEAAEDHTLYQAEVDALLHIWSERFFAQPGAVILYREDIAYVDAQMPVGVYTDMFHFVRLRRASLVLWEGLDLAAISAP